MKQPGSNISGKFIICNNVDSHLDDNKIVTDMQWGFIKRRSTEGILLKWTEIWKKSVHNGSIVGVVFIDVQKAFDAVSHEVRSFRKGQGNLLASPNRAFSTQ